MAAPIQARYRRLLAVPILGMVSIITHQQRWRRILD